MKLLDWLAHPEKKQENAPFLKICLLVQVGGVSIQAHFRGICIESSEHNGAYISQQFALHVTG